MRVCGPVLGEEVLRRGRDWNWAGHRGRRIGYSHTATGHRGEDARPDTETPGPGSQESGVRGRVRQHRPDSQRTEEDDEDQHQVMHRGGRSRWRPCIRTQGHKCFDARRSVSLYIGEL